MPTAAAEARSPVVPRGHVIRAAIRLLQSLGLEIEGDQELQQVELSHKGLDADALNVLSALVRPNGQLLSLKLGYNDLRDEGAFIVARGLESHRSIQLIDLGFNGIGDNGVEAIAKAMTSNQTLQTLYLSGNCIQAPGFKALAAALSRNRSLTSLHLSGNAGGPQGADALADALARNTTLQTLYMSGNNIGPAGAMRLADALSTNHHTAIRRLYLGNNKLGDAGVTAIAEALGQYRKLEVLELSFNGVTEASAEALANALWNYNRLSGLYIDNNKLGDTGVRFLASVLPTVAVEVLQIGFNEISNEGLSEVIQAVMAHPTLRELGLSGNTLTTEGARVLSCMLTHNTVIQDLFLDHMAIGTAGERFIAAGAASGRRSILKTLTGFALGPALVQLGSPAHLAQMTNEQALQFLRDSWAQHEVHAQETRTRQLSGADRALPAAKQARCSTSIANLKAAADPDEQDLAAILGPSSQGPVVPAAYDAQTMRWLEEHLLPALRELASVPFDHAELWQLRQHFYSPAQQYVQDNPQDNDDIQPAKRLAQRAPMSLISFYPRLKHRLDMFKAEASDNRELLYLRQLRHIELFLEQPYWQGHAPIIDPEAILLDIL